LEGEMMRKCSECGKKLGFFEGYSHPVEGKKKCVCGKCWDKLEKSEKRYCSFIMNEFKKLKIKEK
jgi:predicted amidophosphoribosyltransferase